MGVTRYYKMAVFYILLLSMVSVANAMLQGNKSRATVV